MLKEYKNSLVLKSLPSHDEPNVEKIIFPLLLFT